MEVLATFSVLDGHHHNQTNQLKQRRQSRLSMLQRKQRMLKFLDFNVSPPMQFQEQISHISNDLLKRTLLSFRLHRLISLDIQQSNWEMKTTAFQIFNQFWRTKTELAMNLSPVSF